MSRSRGWGGSGCCPRVGGGPLDHGELAEVGDGGIAVHARGQREPVVQVQVGLARPDDASLAASSAASSSSGRENSRSIAVPG
ncbi:MAG: hypothetical protein ACRD2W_05215 [Acidimicrobiales bacterium]